MAYDKTSAGTGNWNTAATWTPVGVPDPATQSINIAVGHTVTMDVDVDISLVPGLFVAGTLTVPATKTLVILPDADLTVTAGGALNIQDGAFFYTEGAACGVGTYNFLDGSQSNLAGGAFVPAGTFNCAAGSLLTVSGGGHLIDCNSTVAGYIELTGGSFGTDALRTLSLASTGSISVGPTSTWVISGATTIDAGGELVLAGGTLQCSAGSLDLNEPLTTTAASAITSGVAFAITGMITATHAITWSGTYTLTVDEPGTLNLGGIVPGLPVTFTPDAADAIILQGTVYVGANITLSGWSLDFGSAILIASANFTLDGTDAAAIDNDACCIFANGKTVTIDDLGYATTAAPIICVGCTAGATANGAGVNMAVPQRAMCGVGF